MSNSDYTLLDNLDNGSISLNVWEVHDLKRRQDISESVSESSGAGVAPVGVRRVSEAPPLSTVHIRPKVEYRRGASVIRSVRGHIKLDAAGDEDRKKIGGQRGNITTFSFASRRRQQRELAGVRRDAPLPSFITLTYPNNFPDAKQAKRDLKVFNQRFVRQFPDLGACWKLEPQMRGAPHFHMLAWGVSSADLFSWIPENWFDIAGGGDKYHLRWHMGLLGGDNVPCVSSVENYEHMQRYVTKYLSKSFEVSEWAEQWTGRYWGFLKKINIPFGEWVKVDLHQREVYDLQRLQRRFANIKSRGGNTLTTLCDAEQWVNKLFLGVVNGKK